MQNNFEDPFHVVERTYDRAAHAVMRLQIKERNYGSKFDGGISTLLRPKNKHRKLDMTCYNDVISALHKCTILEVEGDRVHVLFGLMQRIQGVCPMLCNLATHI